MSSSAALTMTHQNWSIAVKPSSRAFIPRVRDEDSLVLSRVRHGDRSAFEEIVHRYSPRLYRALMGITGNIHDAEDGVQSTFLKAFEKLNEFKGDAVFSTWLTRIAINEGLQILRRHRPQESVEALDTQEANPLYPCNAGVGEDPEQICSRRQTQALLEKALMRLPLKYRIVVVLRDVEQLSTEETSHALGIKTATMKARLLRGRSMLRAILAPHLSTSIGRKPMA